MVPLTEANHVKHHNTERGVFFHDRGVFRISLKKHEKKNTGGCFFFENFKWKNTGEENIEGCFSNYYTGYSISVSTSNFIHFTCLRVVYRDSL